MANHDFTMTMCPTLTNPQAFDTVPTLRAELQRANDELFALAQQLHNQKNYSYQVEQTLFGLVELYRKGELKAVLAKLDDLNQRCKR